VIYVQRKSHLLLFFLQYVHNMYPLPCPHSPHLTNLYERRFMCTLTAPKSYTQVLYLLYICEEPRRDPRFNPLHAALHCLFGQDQLLPPSSNCFYPPLSHTGRLCEIGCLSHLLTIGLLQLTSFRLAHIITTQPSTYPECLCSTSVEKEEV
jgi:hypothetical protein